MQYDYLSEIQTPGYPMKVAFACLLLVLAKPGGDGASNRDTYVRHISKGDEFYHSFDNERALIEYKIAYEMAPDSFVTLERLVSIYGDMGRIRLHKDTSSETFYRMALAFADSLNERFPGRAESHFWLALSQGSLIPFHGAKEKVQTSRIVLREANRAIEIDSGFVLAYVILGIFQREAAKISWLERLIANVVFGADFSGSLAQSETFLRRSVTLNPSNSYGYYELFMTYKAMNDTTRAIQSLQRLLTIAPTNSREQQQTEEATRQLSLFDKKP
jgi:tetratricopeptide (TPR) repeat protein